MTTKANILIKELIAKLRIENAEEMSKENADERGVSENRKIIKMLYLELMEDEFEKHPINKIG